MSLLDSSPDDTIRNLAAQVAESSIFMLVLQCVGRGETGSVCLHRVASIVISISGAELLVVVSRRCRVWKSAQRSALAFP